MDEKLQELSQQVGEALLQHGWLLVTAESCTGGWLAQTITAIAGSSAWFDRGFVTYSNQSKTDMLDVNPDTLLRYGAVSENTVREMTAGALLHSVAHVAIAISGVAGPTGGSADKPVGTVCIAQQTRHTHPVSSTCLFTGNREQIREQSVLFALRSILEAIHSPLKHPTHNPPH